MGLTSSAQAQGTMRLRIENVTTGNGVVVTDNSLIAGADINALLGALTVSVTIDSFIVNVTTGTSKPILPPAGSGLVGNMDLSSVHILSSGTGDLRVTLEDTSFTPPNTANLALAGRVGGTFSAPAGSTVNFRSFADGTNAVPALGGPPDIYPTGALPAIGAIPAGAKEAFSGGTGPGAAGVTIGAIGAFAASGSTTFNSGAAGYSIFAQVLVHFTGPGTISWDEEQQVTVPGPGGLVLALVALPGFGLAWLRRRLKKA
jgi:hypothetical protein